ncbi:MAG: transporter substrate-binding domain-containing protein [Thermomicrobiales bacterium]
MIRLRQWFASLAIVLLVLTLAAPLAVVVAQDATPAAEGAPITVPAEGQSATIDKIRKNGKLRVGVAVAAPWLLQDPSTKKYYGPAVDLVERIGAEIGVPVEYIDSGWDVIVAGLQADKFDLTAAPLFATPARMEVIDFVNYTSAGTCYFAKKDNAKVNSLEDLNKSDVTIVTFTGTGTEEGIRKTYPNATINSIVQPPGGQPPIEDVLSGRADVGPFDSPLAIFLAAQYPDLKILPQDPEYCIAHADIPFPIGMGFNKNDPAFTAFLQSVVDAMQKDIDAAIVKYSDPKYMAPAS